MAGSLISRGTLSAIRSRFRSLGPTSTTRAPRRRLTPSIPAGSGRGPDHPDPALSSPGSGTSSGMTVPACGRRRVVGLLDPSAPSDMLRRSQQSMPARKAVREMQNRQRTDDRQIPPLDREAKTEEQRRHQQRAQKEGQRAELP